MGECRRGEDPGLRPVCFVSFRHPPQQPASHRLLPLAAAVAVFTIGCNCRWLHNSNVQPKPTGRQLGVAVATNEKRVPAERDRAHAAAGSGIVCKPEISFLLNAVGGRWGSGWGAVTHWSWLALACNSAAGDGGCDVTTRATAIKGNLCMARAGWLTGAAVV